MTIRLDISIGPVQGFVAQSRRTRDLWGSSFLLAFLSAHAMRGAKEAGGRIVQPLVEDDPLFRWASGVREGAAPRIGSLPNHFVVCVENNARDIAAASVAAFDAAWRRVCGAVWDCFVAHAGPAGQDTRRIHDRQIDGFWELSWTAGESGAGLLARRKHWRSHRPPGEPGDKCTVMHDRQELSGFVRAGGEEERRAQDEFWEIVRKRAGRLNLRDNERLCAIALVKRLFPQVAEQALGWPLDGARRWPSTVHVGARPWIRRVERAAPEPARAYAEDVARVSGDAFSETGSLAGPPGERAGRFADLDANWLHLEALKDTRCPFDEGAAESARKQLAARLGRIAETRDATGRPLGSPSSFYALLLADGDRLGRLVDKLGGEAVGRALAQFTRRAPEVVEAHDGVTVYAGGDDALAMLPVPRALECAESLVREYKAAFDRASGATLSAAVVFAHIRLPLRSALGESHRLLDDVAKDGNGRGSLAVGVLNPGGLNCQWTTAWTRDGLPPSAVARLAGLVGILARDASDPGLSSALVYRLRGLLAMLCESDPRRPGEWGRIADGLDVRPFLHAEIAHALAVRTDKDAGDRADELVDTLMGLLERAPGPDGRRGGKAVEIGVDALPLARFLVDDARGEGEP